MTPLEIKTLRKSLGCSTRELATAIGVEQETILSWERGDTFPTKRHVAELEAARERGPGAIRRAAKRPLTPYAALADPNIWALVRKIVAHPDLRRAVEDLAKPYKDPADSEDS